MTHKLTVQRTREYTSPSIEQAARFWLVAFRHGPSVREEFCPTTSGGRQVGRDAALDVAVVLGWLEWDEETERFVTGPEAPPHMIRLPLGLMVSRVGGQGYRGASLDELAAIVGLRGSEN